MNKRKNIIVDGKHRKPILLDAYWQTTDEPKGIVVFAHGFKGFKDWGTWSKIGEEIVNAGFIFIKMNFSHNGTTPKNPLEFGDLEAFGQNNYEIELDDLGSVLDWINNQNIIPNSEVNINKISLIGHSRGGGVAIIKAAEDNRISNLITWASVGTLDWMFKAEMINKWKENGVHIIVNGRTKQEMPLYYQLYKNFEQNKKRFSTENALKNLNKPHLIIQGTNDPAIPVAAAKLHQQWNPNAQLVLIENADHVFNGRHPFEGDKLPKLTQQLVEKTILFLKENQ
ncbi:MAG: alpha/beta hydrolase family protein [Saprospiraceae bacterium]